MDITRIELEDETGAPLFVHAEDCGGYCDYACNGTGFEDAKTVNADGTPRDDNREI